MIAATYTQGGQFEVRDVAEPTADDDGALLRVEAASICGTDTKMIRHGHRKLRDGQTIVLGHEFVGTVAAVGRNVRGLSVGQRVGVAPNIGCGSCEMCARGAPNMCPRFSAFGIDRDGAQAQFVSIPAASIAQGSVVPLSGGLSAVDACLAEPLSCAISSVRAAQVGVGDVVVIYGAGPLGLMNAMVALLSGASRIVVVDRNPPKLQLARKLGATDAIDVTAESPADWARRETGGRGVDAVITAAPSPAIQNEAISLLAPFGRLCLFAGLPRGSEPVPLDTNAIHYKQLVVTGMTGGSPSDYRAALKMMEGGRIDVSKVVSDVVPLPRVAEAYRRATSGRAMKVVITIDEGGR